MFVGLDLGTGSVKAVLLAEDGTVRAEGSAGYAVSSPEPGWAESSPEEWWNAAAGVVREVVGDYGPDIAAIGLSGQMHGVVLSDEAGWPLRPAVLWADARSTGQLAAYRALDDGARRRLANPPAAGMAGPTLLWLRENEPEAYSSARWALQPKDLLRLRMTGEPAAEPSDASATLLYDLLSDAWDHELVDELGLREDLLAPLVPSWEVAGTLTRDAAGHFGLRAGFAGGGGGRRHRRRDAR